MLSDRADVTGLSTYDTCRRVSSYSLHVEDKKTSSGQSASLCFGEVQWWTVIHVTNYPHGLGYTIYIRYIATDTRGQDVQKKNT
jgi:hypothetical protein